MMETDEQVEIREEREAMYGARVREFLKDPAVEQAFTNLANEYHKDWKETMNPADREALWAKSRALDELKKELERVVASGERAAHNRNMRQRRRELETARKPRT